MKNSPGAGRPGDDRAEIFRSRCGADGRTRTDDLVFTKHLLYQLSYIGREPTLGFEPRHRPYQARADPALSLIPYFSIETLGRHVQLMSGSPVFEGTKVR